MPSERVQRTHWAAVVTLALATLLVASELSMAAFALPLLGADLGVDTRATAWVLLAYQLPLTALALPAGRWVDHVDARSVYLFSLAGVGLASVLAALAPFYWVLLLGRVLQGFCAAAYLAIYFPVVTLTVREHQRGRALSYISTIMMLGSVAVAPLGGLVAGVFGWRGVFLCKVPLLALMLWMGSRAIPANRAGGPPRPGLPDRAWLREVLLVGGSCAAGLLAFERLEGQWMMSAGLVVAAMAMTACWVRLPDSRTVLELVRGRPFGLPVLTLMLMASLIGLLAFSLPYFIAEVLRRGPELLGTAMLFFVGTATVVSPLAGMLADRYGPLLIATVGAALSVAGMLIMLTLNPAAGLVDLAWRMAALGVGLALCNSPNMTVILNATPHGRAGVAGGVTNIARALGTTLGPAVAALAWSLGGGGIGGFRTGVAILAAFAFAGAIALLAARSRDG